ncbi:MAG: FAD-dependent thymidylate synthase [Clostridia bacterium]|nr:FAD-dependent thymidylate synthase [Clostridia bacterium]
MKVELTNKQDLKENFFKNWGLCSCVCYDTSEELAPNVGKSCLKNGHFSGSRGQYFVFKVEKAPRSLVDQLVRHEVGVFKNVQSFRYVDKSSLDYYIPELIMETPDALEEYFKAMLNAEESYKKIRDCLKEKYGNDKRINENARGVLPMNTNTSVVIGFTIEALINLMNKRLCGRAEEPIRKLANLMKKEVLEVLPELDEYLVPLCKKLGYCPEGNKSCGGM